MNFRKHKLSVGLFAALAAAGASLATVAIAERPPEPPPAPNSSEGAAPPATRAVDRDGASVSASSVVHRRQKTTFA